MDATIMLEFLEVLTGPESPYLSFTSRIMSVSCFCLPFLGLTQVSKCLVLPGEPNSRGWISNVNFSTNFPYVFHSLFNTMAVELTSLSVGCVPDFVTDAPRVA